MPFPIILVDSTDGAASDSAASGAGPTTALTGTSASYAAAVVTLDGTPDLSGVVDTGAHVLYLVTSTGVRFFKITAVDNGADTVTVTPSPAGTASGLSWAIGGVRATIAGTESKALFDRGGAAGDALPGWTVQMQSGHAETIAATFDLRTSGDVTDGPVTLRGEDGASAMPCLTFSNNGNAFVVRANYIVFHEFEMRNSNATKTASKAFSHATNGFSVSKLRINHQTDKFWTGVVVGNSTKSPIPTITECEIAYCASDAVTLVYTATIFDNFIHHNGGRGVVLPVSSNHPAFLLNNIISDNSSDGIYWNPGETTRGGVIVNNTVVGNSGDGLQIANTSISGVLIANNIFASNTGYGVSLTITAVSALARNWVFVGNNFYSNTSGPYTPVDLGSLNESTADPQFTDSANGDYSIGTNLKAKGHPEGGTRYVGKYSTTYSYIDPGAAQRQEPAGGSSGEPSYAFIG